MLRFKVPQTGAVFFYNLIHQAWLTQFNHLLAHEPFPQKASQHEVKGQETPQNVKKKKSFKTPHLIGINKVRKLQARIDDCENFELLHSDR